MKSIPNVISILRILLSLILIFMKPFNFLFWFIYFLCGISDILDGYIARKTNSVSNFGSLIDTFSDIVFMGIAIFIFLPIMIIPIRIMIWILLIALIRVISIIVAYYKYHEFVILHTYGNKITGLLLFIFPFLCFFLKINILGIVMCIVASLSAIEELIIHLISKKLYRDIKWVFKVYR